MIRETAVRLRYANPSEYGIVYQPNTTPSQADYAFYTK